MVLDPLMMNGLRLEDFLSDPPNPIINMNPFRFDSIPSQNQNPTSSSSTTAANGNIDSPEDSEVLSDIVHSYINRMLMEEDVDEKVNLLYQERSDVIQAAEKPFYDILNDVGGSSCSGNSCVDDPQVYPVSIDYSSPSSLGSYSFSPSSNRYFESNPAWQFRKGVEEVKKFLPSDEKLVIDLENSGFSSLMLKEVNAEREESRGIKNPNREDVDLVEGRSVKQSAISASPEETVRSEMFDVILLCQNGVKRANGVDALRETILNEVSKSSQNSQEKGSNGKARGKKQTKEEVVDLRALLIHCAQAVAADDQRSANELLKQIRQYSSPFGDGSQRLAHCFADGLEARLAGNGSQIYRSLVAKRTTATDILKAYQLYLAACPFKRISHFFSNQTIVDISENAPRVHIVDFGISFGFQWPCVIQRLASRPGGPPRLRITGIDVPQPGFHPTERMEETGKRLADYARSFNVPFEYNTIASKWETIKVEDLKIDKDEVLVVNCLYRFRNLVDEAVVVDSPRNKVLDTIRKANPDVFIHGILNGSYSAPFFVTRFREALFHFSSLFDMLEANVPREDAQRLLIERDVFGREALNVISCEGSQRVERPETYKQWQVRNLRAGFTQLPLKPEIMKRARDKVREAYHKDFVIDKDGRWLLQGWKGRIIYAISTWKPNKATLQDLDTWKTDVGKNAGFCYHRSNIAISKEELICLAVFVLCLFNYVLFCLAVKKN